MKAWKLKYYFNVNKEVFYLLFSIIAGWAIIAALGCNEQPQPDTYVYPSEIDSLKPDTIKTDSL